MTKEMYIYLLFFIFIIILFIFLFRKKRKQIKYIIHEDEDYIEYLYPNGMKLIQRADSLILYDENGNKIKEILNEK